jgi:hypothetical protein
MHLGVGLSVGGVLAASALMLALSAGGANMREANAPKIRKCTDRYCRASESTLWLQEVTFADGIRHFDRALNTIGRDDLDACRLQNPGYDTDIFLSIRPQPSTRTWLVKADAYSARPDAPANESVARCFQQLFAKHLTAELVAPEALDAWRDSRDYVKTY